MADPRSSIRPHEMGQDTDAVLGELGYSAAEIVQLRKARVV